MIDPQNIKEFQNRIKHWAQRNFIALAQWRHNGIFLSDAMQDDTSLRSVMHSNPSQGSIAHQQVKIFIEYYNSKDKKAMLEQVQALNKKTFFQVENNTLYDDTMRGRESHWAHLPNYDIKHTKHTHDWYGNTREYGDYDNVSVIDILTDSIAVIGNGQLNHKYIQKFDTNEITEFNKSLFYDFKKRNKDAEFSYYGRRFSEQDLAISYWMHNMDYEYQHGFHKTDMCAEILKLNYVATVDQHLANIDTMNDFIKNVQSAGNRKSAGIAILNHHATPGHLQNGNVSAITRALFDLYGDVRAASTAIGKKYRDRELGAKS